MINKVNKKILISVVSIVIVYILINLMFFILDRQYVPGRDTIESFGDGQYQIIRSSPVNEENIEHKFLYDLKDRKYIEKIFINIIMIKTLIRFIFLENLVILY